MSTPVIVLNQLARQMEGVPTPPDAMVSLPGLALA
jgi:hypothetical protein